MAKEKEKRKGTLRRNGAFKAFMVLLGTVSVIGAAGGTALTAIFAENDMYTETREDIGRTELEDECRTHIFGVQERWQDIQNCMENPDAVPKGYIDQLQAEMKDHYDPSQSNFEFIIHDPDDEVLFQCYTSSSYQYTWTEPFYTTTYETTRKRMTPAEWSVYAPPAGADVSVEEIWVTEEIKPTEPEIPTMSTELSHTNEGMAESYNGALETIMPTELSQDVVMEFEEQEESDAEYQETLYYDVTISIPYSELTHSITGYVREELTANDSFARNERFFSIAYDYRYVPPIVLGVSFVLLLVSVGCLLWAAGWRRGEEDPSLGIFDKIPFDVFTCLLGSGCVISLVLLNDVNRFSFSNYLTIGLFISAILVFWLLLLWWIVSIAVRIRTKTILSNNLIVILWKKLYKTVKEGIGQVQMLPILWQAPLIGFGFFLLQLLGTALLSDGNALGLGLIILLYTAAIAAACAVVFSIHLLEKGAEKISGGDLNYKIPVEKLFGTFKKHGQHLNSIGDGMNRAVSERMKSERFKTELIANVSHDIRTPLTSIINYTDLLEKLDLKNEKAKEYIEVLTRQSARLRKLTEDVLEASKATTGNMKVQKETMDLRVLLEQIQGEYAEKLDTKSLQMVCTVPETPLYISADGRLLWRVMDNLFGNICKYAMPHTRVYLDAFAENGTVELTIRNISAVQLHISADALMERFVQGDRSRNTEGSGLGLSIAQSLTNLQGGSMELKIDGDLFKVRLTFPEMT